MVIGTLSVHWHYLMVAVRDQSKPFKGSGLIEVRIGLSEAGAKGRGQMDVHADGQTHRFLLNSTGLCPILFPPGLLLKKGKV